MKKTVLTALLATAALLPAAAQKQWTLGECIDYAVENNISIKQSVLEVRQREVDLESARGSRLPVISASGSENFSFGRGLTSENTYVNTNTTSTSLSLGLSMPLFRGLKLSNTVEARKLNLEAAEANLEKMKDDIRLAVAKAYVTILYNTEIAEVAASQVRIDSLQVYRLETMADVGKASAAEVAQQKASLAQSRLAAVQADNNLSLSVLDLVQLLELPSPKGFTVAKLDADDILSPLKYPEAIYSEAIMIKPAVKAEKTLLDMAQRNIRIARADFFPSLSLSGGIGSNYYTSNGRESARFFEQLGTNFSQYVGLSLNIPIFSGLSVRSGVKSAKISYEAQKLRLDNTCKQLYKEIQQAYYNALASGSKYEKSLSAVESAREAFTLVEAKYEEGKADITLFDQAKNNYMSALSDLAQARYENFYMRKILDFYSGIEMKSLFL